MSKPILFKKLVNKLLGNCQIHGIGNVLNVLTIVFFTTLELFYILFHFKEMNEILDSYSRE